MKDHGGFLMVERKRSKEQRVCVHTTHGKSFDVGMFGPGVGYYYILYSA